MSLAQQLLRPVNTAYNAKLLGYAPIAYWPLWEASGSQAMDISGNGHHGEHVGVTLGQQQGDFTCPLYDGTLDYTDIYTTSFRDAFNGAEGTILIWGKLFDVGVWTDAAERVLIRLAVNAQNRIQIRKTTTANRLHLLYEAGDSARYQAIDGLTTLDWFSVGITWSKTAGATGESKYFLNGVQQGGTDVNLGVWAGVLGAGGTVIGAELTTPQGPWYGWLAHGAVWDRALSVLAMADVGATS